MKFNKIYIALGMVLALTSCKSDEPVPVEKTEPYMSFTISLSEEGTRAGDNDRDPFGHDWDEDGDDEGIAFDRKIDNVTPVLYSAPGGTIVADVPVGQITDVTKVDNGDGTATFTGALKTDLNIDQLRAGNFRLAVFVNATGRDICGSGINIKNPSATTFHHHGKAGDMCAQEQPFNSIPMYGVAKVDFSGINPADHTTADKSYTLKGESGQKLVIPVLRSMAKIRVTVDKNNHFNEKGEVNPDWLGAKRSVRLKEFTISRHNTLGYVVPRSWDKITSVTALSTTTAQYVVGGSVGGQVWSEEHCTVTPGDFKEGNSTSMLQVYLPETFNDRNDPIVLTVKYYIDGNENNGDELTHTFYIASRYNDINSTQYDIFRNTIYQFDIVGVENNTGELSLNVSVKPWISHDTEKIYY